MGSDRTIHVVNASTLVSDADVATMTSAVAAQVTRDVAPAYGFLPVPVVVIPRAAVQPGMRVISVVDTLQDAQALGWHTENAHEDVNGVVGCKVVLDHGATALTGPYAVATVLSHEVLEMFVDPTCSMWAQMLDARGTMITYEICDPVQSGLYNIGGVSVSDFVTPRWFDSNNAPGDPVSYLKKITTPFTLDKGGYWVQMVPRGRPTQKLGRQATFALGGQDGTELVFGEDVPEWVRAWKLHDRTRVGKFLGKTKAA